MYLAKVGAFLTQKKMLLLSLGVYLLKKIGQTYCCKSVKFNMSKHDFLARFYV